MNNQHEGPILWSCGDYVAVELGHELTGQTITAVGAVHTPQATLSMPSMRFAQYILETRLSNAPGQETLVLNEGRTPQTVWRGTHYQGAIEPELDADDLEEAVRVDGERGLLVCLARRYGCVVQGEDDALILSEMEENNFSRDVLREYLIARQLTNYMLGDSNDRPSVEAYMGDHVIARYDRELRKVWGGFGASLQDVVGFIKTELNKVGIGFDDIHAVTEYFLEQSNIKFIIGQLDQGVTSLSRIQETALAYNYFRDRLLTKHMLDGWGDTESTSPPHRVTTFGGPHIDPIIKELVRRECISPDMQRAYTDLVSQAVGRRILDWTQLDVGRHVLETPLSA